MAIDRRRFLKEQCGWASGGHCWLRFARIPEPMRSRRASRRFGMGVASGDPAFGSRDSLDAGLPGIGRVRRLDCDLLVGSRGMKPGRISPGKARRRRWPIGTTRLRSTSKVLVAGEAYYYGFRVDGTGDRSPTGRTRTLPPSGVERVRLAFASCANYPAGFFNGYCASRNARRSRCSAPSWGPTSTNTPTGSTEMVQSSVEFRIPTARP